MEGDQARVPGKTDQCAVDTLADLVVMDRARCAARAAGRRLADVDGTALRLGGADSAGEHEAEEDGTHHGTRGGGEGCREVRRGDDQNTTFAGSGRDFTTN